MVDRVSDTVIFQLLGWTKDAETTGYIYTGTSYRQCTGKLLAVEDEGHYKTFEMLVWESGTCEAVYRWNGKKCLWYEKEQ